MTLATLNNRITGTKKSWVFFLIIFTFCFASTYAQTGLNFQGVARNSNNVILASQQISLRLSILQGTATGSAEYTETRTVTTNAQGLFTAVIGDAGATSTVGNFNTINWKNTPKYLKIEMDAAAGNNFTTMGTTQFQYVAYAQFANGVDAANITGVVPVEKGGTGVASITALKTALAIDKTTVGLANLDNTTDLLKPISTATQTALNLKANTADVTTSLALKLNKTDTSNLLQKADTITLSNRIDLKVDKVVGKELSSNDYTTSEKAKLAAITGTNTGDQDLSSYATNTALALKANTADVNTSLGLKSSIIDVTTRLQLKEDAFNKSSATDLGGVNPSDVLFPTQKAVKEYITTNVASGGVADAGTLTGNTLNYTVTRSSLTSVGLLNTGSIPYGLLTGIIPQWNQSTTGNAATATKLATSRNINGVAFDGSGDITITATADAGSLTGTTLISTITGSSLTSVGTLANLTVTNLIVGSITGNAATATNATTATTAGTATTATKLAATKLINGVAFDGSEDITITASADAGTLSGTTLNATITGSSLMSVGTITSGVWSGTNIAVTKGGTGLIAAGTNGQILTSTNAGTLTWTTPTTPVFLPTVVIGTQQWMEKNLDVLTYRNGDVIPQVTDPGTWAGLTTGAWCYYNNDPLNGAIYGKLYNWYAVNDSRGLAPQGWHIPTDAEWTILSNLLGGESIAGGKMKTTGTTRWAGSNSYATNESGYAGLPGGGRDELGAFFTVGSYGYWWSANEVSLAGSNSGSLVNSVGALFNSYTLKKMGISVRCVRD